MPYIAIKIASKPDPHLGPRAASALTHLTERILKKTPSLAAVTVEHVDANNWFVGGKSLAELAQASFWLDIKITEGTNTKQEISDYIAAVFEGMKELLGELSDTSYVMVHSVPAFAWGYGGKSQEFRFVSGKLKATAA
jgi:4-oxalocrotonate tautomerase